MPRAPQSEDRATPETRERPGAASFTGRRRRRARPAARLAERAARVLITVGGVGTIAAVTLILVFLVSVVVPLFEGAAIGPAARTTEAGAGGARVWRFGVDEYRVVEWRLEEGGRLVVRSVADGTAIESRPLFPGSGPTACSPAGEGDAIAFGFADGSVRVGRVGVRAELLDGERAEAASRELGDRLEAAVDGALLRRTDHGRISRHAARVEAGEPIRVARAAIRRIDLSGTDSDRLALLDAEGGIALLTLERSENLLTGEVTEEVLTFPLPPPSIAEEPEHLMLSGGGDMLLLAWRDGRLARYDLRDPRSAAIVQELDLVPSDAELSALGFLIGKTTLISGDTRGRVRGWFAVKPEDAGTRDGIQLVISHELSARGPAITALAPSARSRVVVAGAVDGSVRMWHVTSHKLLAESTDARGAAVEAIAIAPKEDSIFARTTAGSWRWDVALGHPEISLAALFRPVWYEGYRSPEHVWQSSSGTDDFEPKFGLWPLIFGTLKATFYSMLFGAPIALLAAVFTSEFLSPRLRTPLKSLTEMMASLPSVVLGFLAALLLAPLVQAWLPAVLATFVTVPFVLLAGAHLWQLLPQRLSVRFSGTPRFALMALCLPLGLLLALPIGPIAERALFSGDVEAWLDGQVGNAAGGWAVLLLPACTLLVLSALARTINPWLRRASHSWTRAMSARVELVKFTAASTAVAALALAIGWMLDGFGLDPRGPLLDTYAQRNALIVGFVMGFAVIPIVYTLAEDALSSVPSHLRHASLGAGATPWQTAVRVVVPTAMSGIFSALMIGLGRAVGETMIVLMATGNTPVTSLNPFDGFRTLSANIAVELPEAVRNSTHYRALFLAALCLFALTFVFNTLAEVVRQRYRKRAFQL